MPSISDDCHGHQVYGTGPTRTPQIRIFPNGSQVCNELRWQTSASLSPYDWNAGSSNHILGGNGSTGDMSVIFSTTQMGCGIIMSPFLPAQQWLSNGWESLPLPPFLLTTWRELPFGTTEVGSCSRARQAMLTLLLPPTTRFTISLQRGTIAGLLRRAFFQRTRIYSLKPSLRERQ
jgi:hypothetical protein